MPTATEGLVVIAEAKRTCESCPAQWEARTEDGRAVYVRFRWGTLNIGIANTVDDAVSAAFDGDAGFEMELGDEYDGFMSFAELKEATAHLFLWPEAEKGRR